jgi:membrane protein
VGLGVSLWSANAAMKSLFDTLNIVYGEEEKRGFVKLNAISLLFTVGGILFVMAALGAIVVIPVALKYMGLSEAADLLRFDVFHGDLLRFSSFGLRTSDEF